MSNPVLRWLAKHEGLAWLGLLLGVAQIVVSPKLGLDSFAGVVVLAVGCLLVGAIGGSRIVLARRRDVVTAIEFEHRYLMTGPRGDTCVCETTLLFKSKERVLESFVHSKRRYSAPVDRKKTQYRNLGPDGRKNKRPPPFIELGNGNVIEIPDASGEVTLVIRPPAPVKKGDVVEIVVRDDVENCFSADTEHIEKEVLFPIALLKLAIRARNSEAFKNCFATKSELGLPAELHVLQPVTEGNEVRLEWEVEHAKPGESYRVSWEWLRNKAVA